MRTRHVFTMWALLVVYMFGGAYLFYAIERPNEEEMRTISNIERKKIQDLLQQHYEKGVARAQAEILERLNEYCGKPFSFSTFNQTNGTSGIVKDTVEEKPFLWSFYNSLLFVICTLSTIGYGNLAPKSRHGRILDVVYGLIGIPFNGIVMLQMAEYFGSVFVKAHSRHKENDDSRFSLLVDILRYLIPGVVIFFLFPAGMFVYFEGWYFDTGIYYAFVTLATIGYGDLVAGQNGSEALEYQIFRIMVLVWILFGLGYMVMIVTMITRAMRSKKVRSIEKKLAYTIKQTQNKIWSEFTQDMTYVRRMLNEMYLLKFQPVYKDELVANRLLNSTTRSQSAPNLTEWPVLRKREPVSSSDDEEEIANAFNKQKMKRRRAYSENVMTPQLIRVMSEGDLSKIDRNATFGNAAGAIEPSALLARVVDALGTPIGSKFSSSDEEDEVTQKRSGRRLSGIHGFSDAEILASENLTPEGKRSRAHSETMAPHKRFSVYDEHRTWSGLNYREMNNLMKMRENGTLKRSDSKSAKSSKSSVEEQLQPPRSGLRRMSMAAINFFNPSSKHKQVERKDSKKKRRTGNTQSLYPSMQQSDRLSLQDVENPESMLEQINYLSHTSGRRASIFNTLANEFAPKSDGNLPISPILEQTSVADFIRLMSSLQARLEPVNSLLNQNTVSGVSKRQSVASLSKDSPLSSLFVRPPNVARTDSRETQASRETISAPQAILRRRLSVNPQHMSSLKPGIAHERRFSLIPPMDVDHPSGQRKSYENVSLRKRSMSQSPLTEGKPGVALLNQRLRRPSLAGSARYISSKNPNRDASRIGKTNPSVVVSNPQGRRKFSVRPVESTSSLTTVSASKTPPASTPAPIPTPPKITIDPVAVEETDENRKMSTGSLEDIVIVRL